MKEVVPLTFFLHILAHLQAKHIVSVAMVEQEGQRDVNVHDNAHLAH